MNYNKLMIEFSKMTKYHHGYMAVNFLDGTLLSNSICVYGEEKSGKSSLLRVLSGVDKATSGSVKINGENPQINKDTYFTFRDGGYLKNKTLKENFSYPLEIRKVDNYEKIVDSVLEEFDLERVKNLKPNRLSLEEKARGIIAKIKLRKTDLLLIDNPFALLSSEVREQYFKWFLKVISSYEGVVVYATDSKEELRHFDEVILLNYGVLKGMGKPEDITLNPSNLFAYSLFAEPKILSGKLLRDQEKSIFSCKEGTVDLSQFEGRFKFAYYLGDCLLAFFGNEDELFSGLNKDFWLFDWNENSIID